MLAHCVFFLQLVLLSVASAQVLEKGEQKTVALLQQLNAIRNDKAGKRREQTTRRRAEHGKKVQKEEAWRAK